MVFLVGLKVGSWVATLLLIFLTCVGGVGVEIGWVAIVFVGRYVLGLLGRSGYGSLSEYVSMMG